MPIVKNDWITNYLTYTEETESPFEYNLWAGISTIAAVLQKKVRLTLGRMTIFPNLYIVLIGPPGMRKSTALSSAKQLINGMDSVSLADNASTQQALVDSLIDSLNSHMVEGKVYEHCSLTCVCNEFEMFLGQKHSNMEMLIFLTDAFDSPEEPWTARTRGAGRYVIPSMYLNLLAATTPSSIALSMPLGAIGGGLSSRMLFIYADSLERRIAIPENNAETKKQQHALKKGLAKMSRFVGEYQFTPEARRTYVNWYNTYEYDSIERLCLDPNFDAWYHRKPLFLQKLSIISAASQGQDSVIEKDDFLRALKWLEFMEPQMANAFQGVGRNNLSHETAEVEKVLTIYKEITETEILRLVMKDIDVKAFNGIIQLLQKAGKISIHLDANGRPFYRWLG